MTVLCPAEPGSHWSSSGSCWVLGELLGTAPLRGGTEAQVSRQFKKETNQDRKEVANTLGQKELCLQLRGEYSMRKVMPVLN